MAYDPVFKGVGNRGEEGLPGRRAVYTDRKVVRRG